MIRTPMGDPAMAEVVIAPRSPDEFVLAFRGFPDRSSDYVRQKPLEPGMNH